MRLYLEVKERKRDMIFDRAYIHGFSIVIPDTIRVVVFAGTHAEKDECMRTLGECVGKCGSFLMRQTHREKEKFRRSRSTNDLAIMTSSLKPTLITKGTGLTPRPAVSPSSPTPAVEKTHAQKLTEKPIEVLAEKPTAEKLTPEKLTTEKQVPTLEKLTPEKLPIEKTPAPEKSQTDKATAEKTSPDNSAASKPISIVRVPSNTKGVPPNRNARVFFHNSPPTVLIPPYDDYVSESIAQPSPSTPPSALSPTFPTLGSSASRVSPPALMPPAGRLGNVRVSPNHSFEGQVFAELPKLSDSPRASEISARLSANSTERRRPIDYVRRFSDSPRIIMPSIDSSNELPPVISPRGLESPRDSDVPGPQLPDSPRSSSTPPAEKKSALRRATSMFNKKKKKETPL